MKDPSKFRGLITALARPRVRAWRSRWSERKQDDSVRSTFARKICCTRGMWRAFSSAECRADWGNLSAAFMLDVWQASKRSTSRGRSGATSHPKVRDGTTTERQRKALSNGDKKWLKMPAGASPKKAPRARRIRVPTCGCPRNCGSRAMPRCSELSQIFSRWSAKFHSGVVARSRAPKIMQWLLVRQWIDEKKNGFCC